MNVKLLNKQTKKDSHFNLDDFVLHNMSPFFPLEPERLLFLCNFRSYGMIHGFAGAEVNQNHS